MCVCVCESSFRSFGKLHLGAVHKRGNTSGRGACLFPGRLGGRRPREDAARSPLLRLFSLQEPRGRSGRCGESRQKCGARLPPRTLLRRRAPGCEGTLAVVLGRPVQSRQTSLQAPRHTAPMAGPVPGHERSGTAAPSASKACPGRALAPSRCAQPGTVRGSGFSAAHRQGSAAAPGSWPRRSALRPFSSSGNRKRLLSQLLLSPGCLMLQVQRKSELEG